MNYFTDQEKNILAEASSVVVGFSGGADSSLALHVTNDYLKEIDASSKLLALHVNHMSQSDSKAWEHHCEQACTASGIQFEAHQKQVDVKGEGFEAAARKVRQEIFASFEASTVIVLGHHLDDQVETVLFRMLRGTGMKGLSGMSRVSTFEDKVILRPLFTLTKSDIIKTLKDRSIEFITDNSNEDNAYSRNYIRNLIIPKMLERWPAGSKNIARMAQLVRQQSDLLTHLLEDNLKDVSDDSGLSIEGLKQYDAFHRSELIRMWLDRNGYASPNENQMKEIEKSFFQSRHEADPVIKFQREDGQKKGVVLTKVNNYILPEELDE